MSDKIKAEFNEKAYVDTFGAVRWKSNDRIPFADKLDLYASAGIEFNMTECLVTRKIEDAEAIKRYAESRKNMSAEQRAEQAYERRAAFGPGETIVDVFTGETFRT